MPERLRVETVPISPLKWIRRIFAIKDEELKIKCGLDGYFYVRFIRAMIIVFLPLMVIIVTILLPINYHGGRDERTFDIGGVQVPSNITGLDTLSWQNVAPTKTDRYWAHLVCALLAISWTLYRIYREKLHFIDVRQNFLLSPEHRLKASARTVLITNIPSEYQSEEALKAFFDLFVDNDDRTKLHVWVNRDYGPLKALVLRCRKLRHALEKEELRFLRLVNKRGHEHSDRDVVHKQFPLVPTDDAAPDATGISSARHAYRDIANAFDEDCREQSLHHRYLERAKEPQVTISEDDAGIWEPVSMLGRKSRGERRTVPKTAWLRFQIARCTTQIEEMLRSLDNEIQFPRQNSGKSLADTLCSYELLRHL